MKKITFTPAERKYIALIGVLACIEAYKSDEGGFTIGDKYLSKIVPPSQYTRGGDVIYNAGRKLLQIFKN